MKVVGYLKVSTETGGTRRQREAIVDYVQKQQMTLDRFIEILPARPPSKKRRKIDLLLSQLQLGEMLVVSSLACLGQSVGEIVRIVDGLVHEGVRFVAISQGIDLNPQTADSKMRVTASLFAQLAEIETFLISQRTQEGLAQAIAAGKKLGRPKGSLGRSKLDAQKRKIKKLLALGVSKASIAKIVGVNRSTLYHFIKSRELS